MLPFDFYLVNIIYVDVKKKHYVHYKTMLFVSPLGVSFYLCVSSRFLIF